MLEELFPSDKELVQKLVDVVKSGFEYSIEALNPEKYPKEITYLMNFYQNSVLFFDYWLEGKGWIPLKFLYVEGVI